jgi:hypothetical protein
MKDRELLKQALEFAEDIVRGKYKGNAEEVRDALRAALEQPPGRWCGECGEFATTRCVGDERACVYNWSAVGATLEQPEPEPVAWIQPDHLQKARVAPFLCRVEPTQRCADFVPLYTHPPRE